MSPMEWVGAVMTSLFGIVMITGGAIGAWVCICYHGKLKTDGVLSLLFVIAGFIFVLSAFKRVQP